MGVLVFITHSITAEDWADFRKAATVPPQYQGPDRPYSPPSNPNILVHSRSQDDYTRPTGDISADVQTQFESASYADLYAFIETLPSPTKKVEWFMVLDELSVKDRKVTIIHKGSEMLNEKGEVDEEDLHMDFLTKRRVWKIHRVPFGKAQEFWSVLDVLPGEDGDQFLQEMRRDAL